MTQATIDFADHYFELRDEVTRLDERYTHLIKAVDRIDNRLEKIDNVDSRLTSIEAGITTTQRIRARDWVAIGGFASAISALVVLSAFLISQLS